LFHVTILCILNKTKKSICIIFNEEFIYSNLNPKKAVDELKKTLKDKSTTPNYLD